MERFLAIDFETANTSPDSACAIGLVLVEDREIKTKATYLIKPPNELFEFTHIHRLTWDDVKKEKTFGELWNDIALFFTDIDFVVAHNASFDRKILAACCSRYGKGMPDVEFRCTKQLSKYVLDIYPSNLANVSRVLQIDLNHHNALSDTIACAKIMLKVKRDKNYLLVAKQ